MTVSGREKETTSKAAIRLNIYHYKQHLIVYIPYFLFATMMTRNCHQSRYYTRKLHSITEHDNRAFSKQNEIHAKQICIDSRASEICFQGLIDKYRLTSNGQT